MCKKKVTSLVDEYDSYEGIPAAKRAWVTIRAKRAGKNPNMAHAGLKAAFTKRRQQVSTG